MNTPAKGPAAAEDPKEVAFRRFCHLMDCRHFNRLCGSGDPATRSWEREHGPEIERLATQNPDFDARFAAFVLARAEAERKRQGELAYWTMRSREAVSAMRRKRQ
jgi:hypothetical protein